MRCEGCFEQFNSGINSRGGGTRNYCSERCRTSVYRNKNQRREINNGLEINDYRIINRFKVSRLKELGFLVDVKSPV